MLLLTPVLGRAQSYNDSIHAWREHYKQEFITEERSPLKGDDTGFLRFFRPDARYRVKAVFTPAADTASFAIPTHSGKQKRYRRYGTAVFRLPGVQEEHRLEIYQSPDLSRQEKYRDHLFLPFNDLTNYEQTYAGGRYIDLSTGDIRNGVITIDFNKAYNPYCAYAGGYNCPIPPEVNRLKARVPAGEKMFGKKTEH